ncbi:MAG: ABC transporter permease [Tessaracoccus sp.]|uniref:ABC transporter permease n=1 Tax=Tessaracoccus sp. TaxID=1971211 RepID=UPI001EC99597|nr:ABC transporter permease [Tessaracoccus sp.]MBK7820838.1 ABC transporter permease [Tessaracoccus sp.]
MTATITPVSDRTLTAHASAAQALRDTLTMAWRSLLRVRRTPEQWADVILQPVIFTVMFAFLFGGAIAGDVGSYLPTLIPGILVQTVITTSVVTGVQLREDMDTGVFDRFRTLPIARIAPLAGALLADTLRYAVATAMTFVVGMAIGYRPAGGVVGVLLAGLLVVACSWAISWIFALLGVVSRSATTVQSLSFLVLFPLTFLSNAFVPIETLPSWLRWFATANPVSHLISGTRALANGTQATGDVTIALLGAAVVVAVFAPLTVHAYMRKA